MCVCVIKEQFQYSMEIYARQFDLCNWIFLLLGFDARLTAYPRSLRHVIFFLPTFWQRLKCRMLLCYESKSRGQIVSIELYAKRHRVLIPVGEWVSVCVRHCFCITTLDQALNHGIINLWNCVRKDIATHLNVFSEATQWRSYAIHTHTHTHLISILIRI